DREAAARLRRSGKPVLLAVNKVDTSKAEPGLDDFAALGFEKMFPVSAIHGEGIDPLMDAALEELEVQSPKSKVQSPEGEAQTISQETAPPEVGARPLKLAI